MPCYSSAETLLIHLGVMETSAQALGIEITVHNKNSITLKKGREYIRLQRESEGSKWVTVAYTGSNNFEKEILEPLGTIYAKNMVKKFAEKRGYTVSAGNKPGELILTSFK